jgi:predicted Zn-dependent protease
MLAKRTFISLLSMAVAVWALPASLAGKATILTEVQGHLDQAKQCVDSGQFALAIAHLDEFAKPELTYSAQFQSVPDKLHAPDLQSLHEAVAVWQEGLGDSVKFREVDSSENADVKVVFKSDVRMGPEAVAGYANWQRSIDPATDGKPAGHFVATLQIRTLDLLFKPMPAADVRHEVMHELGHVLGLEDSDSKTDLMGPLDQAHPLLKPQPHEMKAVLDLRAAAAQIRHDASAQVVKL